MINIEDARISFLQARVEEVFGKVNEVKKYADQKELVYKLEGTLRKMSPEHKKVISELNEAYSLLTAYIVDIFYAAGLLDGMKMPEYMAEACKESMFLQVKAG